MRTAVLAMTSWIAVGGWGCAAMRSGTFDASGFRHLHYEYQVSADPAGGLVPGWILDNYQADAGGEPTKLKVGPGDVRRLSVDANDDGVADDLGPYPVDDLRFRSRQTAGTIWLRSAPMPSGLAETELRVLARMYVDAISGVGLAVMELRPGRATSIERRFATRSVQTTPLAIDGREAFQVTFDVANVDQVQGGGDPRWERAHVVLIRSDLRFVDMGMRRGVNRERLLPVLLVAGYANLPDDFDRELPLFESFLRRVRFETEANRAIRDRVLGCVPRAEVVAYAVVSTFGLITLRSLASNRECIAEAVRGAPIGAVDVWRSFAPRRTPYVPPAPAAQPPAGPAAAVEPPTQQGSP